MRKIFKSAAFAATVFAALAGFSSSSWATPDSVVTTADVLHPNIHQKVGKGDATNANPNGANANGGNIHGIANVPGKKGINPNDDGVAGFANQLNTVHGGIGDKNQNVLP